jgi:hypothetical protein
MMNDICWAMFHEWHASQLLARAFLFDESCMTVGYVADSVDTWLKEEAIGGRTRTRKKAQCVALGGIRRGCFFPPTDRNQ